MSGLIHKRFAPSMAQIEASIHAHKPAKPQYYECGICGSWHSAEWNGDCREDEARFAGPEVFDARHGTAGWDEVSMIDLPGHVESR